MALGRIRSLKPENWSDESVGSVSREARLFRDVLITLADDDGRWRHLPSAILGHGYPYDADLTAAYVHEMAAELDHIGVIHLYESDGVAYGCFPKWHSHQVINKYSGSKLPAPSGVRCTRRNAKKPPGKGSDGSQNSGNATGTLPESDGSSTAPLPSSSGPDQEIPAPDPAPDPSLLEDAGASDLAQLLSDVVAVLRSCSRFTFDPLYAGIANLIAGHPSCDHMAAAYTAAARGADPAYRTTSGARAYEFALRDQLKDRRGGQPQAIRPTVEPTPRHSPAREMRLEMEAAKAAAKAGGMA